MENVNGSLDPRGDATGVRMPCRDVTFDDVMSSDVTPLAITRL